MTLGSILTQFAESTSAHGVKFALTSIKITKRIFWAIVILICVCLFMVQLVDLVLQYQKFDKIVKVQLGYRALPFPAVTVCNLNPFRMSMLKEVPELAALLAAFDAAADQSATSRRRRRQVEHDARMGGLFNDSRSKPETNGKNLALKRQKRITCDSGWTPVGSYCYISSEDLLGLVKVNYDDAQTACANQNARLPVLEDKPKTDLIVAHTISWYARWTSLQYDPALNELRWVLPNGDKLNVGYTGYNIANQTGDGDNCYMLKRADGALYQKPCSDIKRFLCEKGALPAHDICPLGTTQKNPYCYSFVALEPVVYEDIEMFCIRVGGRLPIVPDEAANQNLGQFLDGASIPASTNIFLPIIKHDNQLRWSINGTMQPYSSYPGSVLKGSFSTNSSAMYNRPFTSNVWAESQDSSQSAVCQFDMPIVTTTTAVAPPTTTTTMPTTTTTMPTTTTTMPTTTTTVPTTTTTMPTTTTTMPTTTTTMPTTTTTMPTTTTTMPTTTTTMPTTSTTTPTTTTGTAAVSTTMGAPVVSDYYCVSLSLITRGTGPIYSNADRPVGATASFSCDPGLIMFGNHVIACGSGGIWNNSPPNCKSQCPVISLTASLAISVSYSDTQRLQSSTASFACDADTPTTPHILVPTTSTCLEDGTWSQPFPSICLAISEETQQDIQAATSDFNEVANNSMALQQRVTDSIAYFAADLSKEQVVSMGHQLDSLIGNCRYAGAHCQDELLMTVSELFRNVVCLSDFQYTYDPTFSNCYSFNNRDPPRYNTNRAGATQGLLLQVFINQSDYMSTTERGGIMITIHDQQETVVADTMGLTVAMGYLTSFGVMLTKVQRLGPPYGDCVMEEDNNKLFYFKTKYSIEGCYRSCYQKNLIEKCKCGDPRLPLPAGAKYCSVKQRYCVQRFVDDKLGLETKLDSCDCPAPCTTAVYTTVQSQAKWPAISAMPLECRTGTAATQERCLLNYRKNNGRVEIFFMQMNFKSLSESPAFSIAQLLSAIGGNIGLWIGVSFITVVEFGHLGFSAIAYVGFKKTYQ